MSETPKPKITDPDAGKEGEVIIPIGKKKQVKFGGVGFDAFIDEPLEGAPEPKPLREDEVEREPAKDRMTVSSSNEDED